MTLTNTHKLAALEHIYSDMDEALYDVQEGAISPEKCVEKMNALVADFRHALDYGTRV